MKPTDRIRDLLDECEGMPPINVQVAIMDVRRELDKIDAIVHNSTLDPVTGLPTRRVGNYMLERAATHFNRGEVLHRFVVLDVDDLKVANDMNGHAYGDAMLANLGAAMLTSVRPTDFVCRWGGDEFLLILEFPFDIDSPVRSHEEGEIMRRIASETFARFSWGSATLDEGGSDGIDDALERADSDMYRMKNAKKRLKSSRR
jgi:diguanylate cyclase (GGDEF)-like protein